MEENEKQYCEVGQHETDDLLLRCAKCERSLCIQHQGNPDVTGGNYVACLDHVAEVAELNAQHWAKLRRHGWSLQ